MSQRDTAIHVVISGHASSRFFSDYGIRMGNEMRDEITKELYEFINGFGKYINKFLEYCEQRENRIKITPTLEALVMVIYQYDIVLVVVRYVKIIGRASRQTARIADEISPEKMPKR